MDANSSYPSRNPVGDPMTMTPAMTPAQCSAYGHATSTVTILGSNKEHTHERASCGYKTQVTAPINTGHGGGMDDGSTDSTNSSEDNTKETLVVDHNTRVETSISGRESVLLINQRSGSILGID